MDRFTPKPMSMQRGSDGAQSTAPPHSALHFMPALAESVHSALAQSASPMQPAPTRPAPRAPGMQNTFTPVESSEWQVKPGPQSSDEKHGQSVFTAQVPPSQYVKRLPPSG